MTFQIRAFSGAQPSTSIPRSDLAVSAMPNYGYAHPVNGAGADAVYIDLLNDALQYPRAVDANDDQDVLEATINVKTTTQPKLKWIDEVYSLVAKSKPAAAMDVLLACFNSLLSASEFETCDSALRSFDFRRLDTTLMVSILSITRPAKTQLGAREEVVRDIEKVLREQVPDRTERLLKNLR